MSRKIEHRYEDPLDRLWLDTAARIGLEVRRTPDAYASTDGRGTLFVGETATLDADDCLAQMIFHELAHSLVEGPASFAEPDWGLCNETERDLEREYACLRAQAALAGRYGLRAVLAPTTDHRTRFDALPVDPLSGTGGEVTRARVAVARAARDPWAPHLAAALEATATIVRAVGASDPGSLHSLIEAPAERHPIAGLWVAPGPARACRACAWRAGSRCELAGDTVRAEWASCEAFVSTLECETCGACCREAFDTVEIEADDPSVEALGTPPLRRREGRIELRRIEGCCPLLEGDGSAEPFRCSRYAERPRTCRELERGSANCLLARRRVGLSI